MRVLNTRFKVSDYLQKLVKNSDRAASMLTLLANPKRLMILCHLMNHDMSVGQLGELVGLSHSAISQHLSKLRSLGVVSSSRSGKEVIYEIVDSDVKAILATLYKIYCK